MATKNDLNYNDGADAHHTELATAYVIDDATYTLSAIVKALADAEGVESWNGKKMADKLAAVKEYIANTGATPVTDADGDAGDGQEGSEEFTPPEDEGEPAKTVILDGAERIAELEDENAKLRERITEYETDVANLTHRAETAEASLSKGRNDEPRMAAPGLHGTIDELKPPY